MRARSSQFVKLGGSLLAFEQLESHWLRWYAPQGDCCTIVIVGGGNEVELLRRDQQLAGMTDVDAHWEAIKAMGHNARRIAKRLGSGSPRGTVIDRLDQIGAGDSDTQLYFLDPIEILRDDESTAEALPYSWDVTSDSIAARIARILDCRRLVLLKSTLPRQANTYSTAAANGYVDRYFPRAAAWIDRVECVNLRSTNLSVDWLQRGPEIGTGAMA